MFPIKPRENVIPIEKEIEADFLRSVLKEKEIPSVFITYHDTAFDGLYQLNQGWGHVEVPLERANEVKQLYRQVKESSPSNI